MLINKALYSDPGGVADSVAIGMLSIAEDDKLGMKFDRQGKAFLNLRIDISAISILDCGSVAIEAPTYKIWLMDSTDFGLVPQLSGVRLDSAEVTGIAPTQQPDYELNWSAHLVNLDASAASGDSVSIVWDLIAGGYAVFDNLVISASDARIELPVELSSFDVVTRGQAATLGWGTSSETNNAGFEVQSKPSGSDIFTTIGFVEGGGTTVKPQRYSFVVARLQPGHYRFRLRQIDFDGAVSYSPEVEAEITIPGSHFVGDAYPNPFLAETGIMVVTNEDQWVTAELFDVSGRRVSTLHAGFAGKESALAIRVQGDALVPGIYFVRVTGERFVSVSKIVRAQ